MNKIIKAKINSFLESDTSSSIPHLFGMLDNSYSLNTFKPECSSTWDCIWLLTVCLFLRNLIMVYKSPINVKSRIDLKFILNVHGLSWIACLRLKQTKVKIILFQTYCFSIDIAYLYSPIFGDYERLSY